MAGRGPDWDDIRVFSALARAGSLGAAARDLRVSEATVGRHLRRLEAGLGGRLFDRLPNGLRLTSLGGRLLAAAGVMEEGAAGFGREAVAAAAGDPGTVVPVRVTATTSVALFLARHLDGLLASAPRARVDLQGTRAVLSLTRHEAEVALRMRRPPERGGLTVRRIGRVAFAVYGARAYLDGRRFDGTGDLRHLDVIGLRDDPDSRQARWLDAAADASRVRVRLGEVHLRREAVARGLGVSLLPCFLGDAGPDLVRVVPPPPELCEDVFLLVRDDLKAVPAVRELGQALARLFRDQAATLGGLPAGGP